MRVLVCGSRTYEGWFAVSSVLDGMLQQAIMAYDTPLVVIDGAAKGADTLAAHWYGGSEDGTHAIHDDVMHESYPADWTKHGKAAGPIRNQQMLNEGKPEIVWAFVDKPLAESRGTADMVRRARAAGIPTFVVESDPLSAPQ